MRLFAAIDVDDTARERIVAFQRSVARRFDRRGGDLRWTTPEQLHLTLAFVGEVDEAVGAAVADAIKPPIGVVAYTLVLCGLGVFPAHGAPRVLWLGSSSGARETIDVQRIVAERLAVAGIELERRPFHAHLTLARWRSSAAADRRIVLEAADTGEVARTDIDAVTLYQSRLSPRGSTYTPIVRAPLSPR